MKGIYKLLFLVLLGTAVALAQAAPSQSAPDQSQQTPDQSQQPPSAAGSQSQYPSSSGQTGASQAGQMSSSDVKTAIQTAFQQDPSLMNSGISVSVSNDKVTLSGTASSADKDKAHKIAEANAGGRQVVDNVKVSGSSSDSAAPKSQ